EVGPGRRARPRWLGRRLAARRIGGHHGARAREGLEHQEQEAPDRGDEEWRREPDLGGVEGQCPHPPPGEAGAANRVLGGATTCAPCRPPSPPGAPSTTGGGGS